MLPKPPRRAWVWMAFAAFLLAGESVEADAVTRAVTEATTGTVGTPDGGIEIRGLRRVDPDLIAPHVEQLGVQSGKEEVARAIRTLYELGYFDRIVVERQDGRLVWTFDERPFVIEVVRTGFSELGDEKVDGAISVRAGVFLEPSRMRQTEKALERLYAEEGYAEADVQVRTEPVDGPGEVRVVVASQETEKVRILEVRVKGNREARERELLSRLKSRPPNGISWLTSSGDYEKQAAERDRFRLEAYYLEHGYLKVAVDGPDVSHTPAGNSVIIEYNVREGKQYELGNVTFRGDVFFRRATLRDWFTVDQGEPLNRLKLEEAINTIVENYSDYGFAFARVEPQFSYDEVQQIADVELEVVRGPLVYIRDITIQGNTKTRDKVVRRELTFNEGELFSGSQLRLSRERVYALGFFEAVTFETEAVGEDLIDIRVRVTEKPTGTASAGVGYSSIDQFVGNLKLNFGNLAGYGIRLNLEAEFGGRRQTFRAGYTDPYFLDSPFSLGIDVFRNRQEFFSGFTNVQSYTQENLGGSVSLGYKVALYNRIFLTFRDELIEYTNLTVRSDRFFTGGETRSLQPSWRRDARNHPYDPTNGNLFLASVEFAGHGMGGDHEFTKYRLLEQHFVTFFNFLTLMLKAEAGMATTPGNRVPFAERYFLGGIFTLRGFDFRTVGPSIQVPANPRDPYSGLTEVFVGGNKQVLFSSELIFPLVPPAGIKGVLFWDAGNTWLEEQPFFATRLRMGYGFGFRWFSPIGPLRFEWGFPFDRQPGERARVFEFSIGSFF